MLYKNIIILLTSLLLLMMMVNSQVVSDTSKTQDSIHIQCHEVRVEQMNINQELKKQLRELKEKLKKNKL